MNRTMRLRPLWLIVAVLVLALAACSAPRDPATSEVRVDGIQTRSLFADRGTVTVTCPGPVQVSATEIRGSTFDGAEYLIYVPDGWKAGPRDLVLYAHGFIDPTQPVGFPSPLPEDVLQTRDALMCRGFALAASSYSANGYAVAEGVRDTHLLNPIFWTLVGVPSHTYLFGASLGGLIVTQLAESFPWRYDGAMPICGPVGGSLLELDYIGNVRLFFDMLYPHVLRGSVTEPAPPPKNDWRAKVTRAVERDPSGLAVLGSLFVRVADPANPSQTVPVPILQVERDPETFAPVDGSELLPSLLAALRYHVEGGLDAVQRVYGSNPFDNHATVYQQLTASGFVSIDSLDGESIPRFTAGMPARLYYTLHYQPRGNLAIPMLTLHNVVDPDVPYFHEAVYEALAASSGYLLSVPVPIPTIPGLPPLPADPVYGHCAVDPANAALAFGYLVSHVEVAGGGPWPVMPATLQALGQRP